MKPMNCLFLFAFLLSLTLLGQAAERPNVILMMADDLGYETLSANEGRIRARRGERLHARFHQPEKGEKEQTGKMISFRLINYHE